MQIGPYAVPKGTALHISIYSMHRDERWWEDPLAFKPERWVGDKTGGDRSGGLAYLPFGSGPKMCIGYKLACKAICSTCLECVDHICCQLTMSVGWFSLRCCWVPHMHQGCLSAILLLTAANFVRAMLMGSAVVTIISDGTAQMICR